MSYKGHFMGWILALFLLFAPHAYASEESIWVELETESPLMPLYLSPLYDHKSGFDSEYLTKLRKVIAYDLNYNGMTRLVEGTKGQAALLQKAPFEEKGDLADLQKIGAYYVVKVRVKNKTLSARLIVVNSNSMKQMDGIALSGDLAQDRRQVHKLADTIYKELFGFNGIASTHFLFTNKYECPKTGKMVSEIFEADWDGANLRPLTVNCGYAVTPSYVPPLNGGASGAFFYVSYKNGQPKIFVSSLKEFNPVRFSLLKGNQLMPAISKSRDKVAFISDVTGNPDLFMQPINSDGSPKGKPSQIFSSQKATQASPSFSPKGDKIAFVSNKDGAPRVYTLIIPQEGASLKNIRPELISKYNKESTAPSWSPDGKKIAYTSMTDGTRQIWVYDFDKKRERQLTHGPGNKENPSWAPDSLHLVFNSSDKNTAEVYVLNLNQPEALKVTSGKGIKRFPAWEPR